MKKLSFVKTLLTGAVLSAILVSFFSCEKETVLDLSSSKVPTEIKNFVETHFPNNKILQVVKDVEGFIKTYEVTLTENISLEFNRKKEIIDIESKTKLPDSVIPNKILDYVNTNFPDNYITDWELESKKQQVGLDNGLELEFSIKGEFLRIDD